MTDLPEQLPDARAVLAAAYGRARAADAANEDSAASDWDTDHHRRQAAALAAIGAGLATIEAADYNLVRNVAELGRRLAAVEAVLNDGRVTYSINNSDNPEVRAGRRPVKVLTPMMTETDAVRAALRGDRVAEQAPTSEAVGLMAAARVVEQWQALPYTSRHEVLAVSPALAETLNGAADLLGATDADRAAEQVQPLPPVDDADRCKSVQLGQRCVRLTHDADEGHMYLPLVPAGSDRFA